MTTQNVCLLSTGYLCLLLQLQEWVLRAAPGRRQWWFFQRRGGLSTLHWHCIKSQQTRCVQSSKP